MVTLQEVMFVLVFVALCLIVLGRVTSGDEPVRHSHCPRCGSAAHAPDHAVGCNKCDRCGVWFPMGPHEQ